jgi:hypothetical protein
MKINETSNNSFQNKVLIDTFIEQISALQTDVGDLQIADDNLAQALAAKANAADISNEVSTGTLNATNGNIKTLKVQGPGSEATLENATIGEATIGTENVTQSNITNLEVMDVDAGTVRSGTIVVENDATISGNLAVQDIGAKDITSASVSTLNLTAAEADINKLEAQNAEITGKLEVNDLEVSGNFTGVSSIEAESIESENITSTNADIETLNVENIRNWVSQVMNQEQMLTPSPQLGNVDRYTIELPSFDGVFLLSWEDSDVLWSATVIGNGKSYGISWGSKTEENYITDIFQYNGKLYIRINCNGKLKYAYSATKELSPITIYFNMNGWTKEKSLEELCDKDSHIENAYPTGTAWLGPVFIPRLVEGEGSGKGINFKGSCTFAEIPSFADTVVGDVWNITDEAYTDNRFVEGAGKPINAGDDIVAVEVEGTLPEVAPYFKAYGDTWTVKDSYYSLFRNDTLVARIDSGDVFTDGVSPYYLYQDSNYDYEAYISRIEEDGTETELIKGYSLDNGCVTDDYIYVADELSLKRSPKDNILWEGLGFRTTSWEGKHGDTIFYWDENADESSFSYFVESDPSIYGDLYGSFSSVQAYFAGENVLASRGNEYYIFNFTTHQFDLLSDTSAYDFVRLANAVYLKGVSYVIDDHKLYKTTDGITWIFVKDLPEEIIKLSYGLAQRYLKLFGQDENNNYYDILVNPGKSLKWDKFAAGVNYDNFVAKNITATESLKSEGTFEVDGTSQFDDDVTVNADLNADKVITPDLEVTGTMTANNTGVNITRNVTHTGNYTATGSQTITGNLTRTGNETISGLVIIGELD